MKNVVVQFSSKLAGPFLIVMFWIFEFHRLGMLSRVCWLVKQLCSAKQLHTLKYLVNVVVGIISGEKQPVRLSLCLVRILGGMFSYIEYFFIYSDFRAHSTPISEPYLSISDKLEIQGIPEKLRTGRRRTEVYSVKPVGRTPRTRSLVNDSLTWSVMLMVGNCPWLPVWPG